MSKNKMAQLIAENQRLRQRIAEMEAARPFELDFVRQMTADFYSIAAKRAHGHGPKRQKETHDVFMQVSEEYSDLIHQDFEDDKELWFLQSKLDEEVKSCYGEYFVPYEERYN